MSNYSFTQAQWVRPVMTWAMFAGFLQTDGTITFLITSDKVFKPSIIISQSPNQADWLEYVGDFLKQFVPSVQIETSSSLYPGRATNIRISRQANCRFIIQELDKLTVNGRPILMDAKLRDFLLLKEAFKANDLRQNPATNLQGKQRLIDVKMTFQKIRPVVKGTLCRKQLEQRLNVPLNSSLGSTGSLLENIEKQIDQIDNLLFQSLINKSFLMTLEVCQFISGCFDGDGSFQINTLTHPLEDKNHTPFDFVPQITLTNKKEPSRPSTLYSLCSYAFKEETTKVVAVSKTIDADRYICNKLFVLRSGVTTFFDQYPPTLEQKFYRYEAMKAAVSLIPNQHKDKTTALKLLDIVYENPILFDITKRSKTKQEYLSIIEDYFQSKR